MGTFFKKIGGWLAGMALPYAIRLISKSPGKIGVAVKESIEVYDVIKDKSKDGVIDVKDLKDITPEVIEAFVAIFGLFNKKVEIKVKKE